MWNLKERKRSWDTTGERFERNKTRNSSGTELKAIVLDCIGSGMEPEFIIIWNGIFDQFGM